MNLQFDVIDKYFYVNNEIHLIPSGYGCTWLKHYLSKKTWL